MAYAPIAVANELLMKHAGDGIDPLKLQKLLYYANGWWLALKGEPLVNERPQVWRHGPVFRSIYRAFRGYGWRNIEAPSSPFGGEVSRVDGENADQVRGFLDWIWREYGEKSGVELSEDTHAEGTPWRNIAEAAKFRVEENTVISASEDWTYFADLARQRGIKTAPLATA